MLQLQRRLRSRYTYTHEADKLLVADSLVRFVDGGGTVGAPSVAEAGVPAAVVITTLVPELELALGRTARTLPQNTMLCKHCLKMKQGIIFLKE